MGQIVSRTSRIHNLILETEISSSPNEIIGYDGDDEVIPSADLTIPFQISLLDRYSIRDLDKIIQDHFILYISEESFICCHEIEYVLGHLYHITFCIDNSDKLYSIYAKTHEDAEVMLNAMLHLLLHTLPTSTEINSIHICYEGGNYDQLFRPPLRMDRPLMINLDDLHKFLNRLSTSKCSSTIRLYCLKISAEQGAILASSSLQENVRLQLHCCSFEDSGLMFGQGIANNYGPNKLEITHCYFTMSRATNESTLAVLINICNAMANTNKNTRLKELQIDVEMNDKAFLSLGTMLASNKGLISLSLLENSVAGETAFLQCLHKHPTLEHIKASNCRGDIWRPSDDDRVKMTEPLVQLIKQNSIIREIELFQPQFGYHHRNYCFDETLIRTEIQPHLEIRQYRHFILQVHNINNERTRIQILGEYLLLHHDNLSLIWLLVRDNHDVIIDKILQQDDKDDVLYYAEPPLKQQKITYYFKNEKTGVIYDAKQLCAINSNNRKV